jgi:uncharacterized RDD family membrane protein YckC
MTAENTTGSGGDLFWPRLIAAAIDVALFVVLANLLAVALYAATDGKLRSSTLMSVTRCAPLQAISTKALEGLALPFGYQPTSATLCKRSLLGLETARYLTIGLQAQEGEVTRSLAVSRPVNHDNLPLTPVILDWAYPLGLILLLAALEWGFGRTPGKLLLRLKVSASDGRRLPPHRALLRNLVIYGAAAAVMAVPVLAAAAGVTLPLTAYVAAVALLGGMGWAPLAMLSMAKPQALYDRWAGAQVVRT